MDELEALLESLGRAQLERLSGLIAGRLAERAADQKQAGENHRGHIELKIINGYGPYAYRRHWQDGHLRSEYIGKVKQ